MAEAALARGGIERVELVVSRAPLGKAPTVPSFEDRLSVLGEVAGSRPWLSVSVTSLRLIAEVARGYSAVIMGADKWEQVLDPHWYGGSTRARDEALASLPPVLLAPRAEGTSVVPPASLPPVEVVVLEVHDDHRFVSSTGVRAGRREWMLPEAARFDELTGAWSDPGRYRPQGASSGPGAAASLPPMPGPRRSPE